MRIHSAPRVLLMALTLGVLSIACQEGVDVPQLIEDTAADSCLPFNDNARMQEILGGDWRVGMPLAVTSLTRCENPTFDGRAIVSAASGVVYHAPLSGLVIETFPPIFVMIGTENAGRNRFTAEIDSATCLSRLWIWNENERLWFLCSGPFDPANRKVTGTCLGAEIDLDGHTADRQGVCVLADPLFFDLEAVAD